MSLSKYFGEMAEFLQSSSLHKPRLFLTVDQKPAFTSASIQSTTVGLKNTPAYIFCSFYIIRFTLMYVTKWKKSFVYFRYIATFRTGSLWFMSESFRCCCFFP